ncbi:MAG: right-handed parallel beta-helix repeat-containing protein [Planctomycetota bacterium]
MNSKLIPLAAAILVAVPVFAQSTILVPDPTVSIQGAIVAAANGDTILVGAGTWTEQLDFLGKAIHVKGLGPSLTTIDAQNQGSVVRFSSGEQSNSILEGIRLTGGRGDYFTEAGASQHSGGGIVITGSFYGSATPICSPTIIDVLVDGCFGNAGAGIFVWGASHAHLIDCRVVGSTRVDPLGLVSYSYGGEGILVERNAYVTMTGGEISQSDGAGYGGLDCSTPSLIEDVLISLNFGGGICTEGSQHVIRRCRIWGNFSLYQGGGICLANGGPSFLSSPVLIEDCVIEGNYAPFAGGAIAGQSFVNIAVSNCTIVGNVAPMNAALYTISFAAADIRNSIVRGNGPAPLYVTPTGLGGLTIRNSNVEFGASGPGNVDVDPRFVDVGSHDYRLAHDSPMIDAGDDSLASTGGLDRGGLPRILNGTVDIGAHESNDIANHAAAAGTVSDPSSGAPFRTLRVNGDDGGDDYRVEVPAFAPWSLSFTSPPWLTPHPDFALFGAVAEATIQTVVNVPLGIGEMAFLPCPLAPQFEGPIFTLASTVPLPCSVVLPAAPAATWSTPAIVGLPAPLDLSFQGVILDATGQLDVTNLVIVRIR